MNRGNSFAKQRRNRLALLFPLLLSLLLPVFSQSGRNVVNNRRTLVIPGDMAYGANPPPGAGIAPNETLVFTVDMVDVSWR